ncbi:NADPH-dependent aldehyde reductase ARI1-like isoform X1 [Elysia marginata]|uniref:NADPH-dependent aldehyde reductase ARI1-like isoform X1 n=1 Tax=Elysia marginata TaxID=1093978 RepID=A0AAV4IXZ0_9GAST|nr:NADPH-dependent aldehyde reductase ARI1-like isoform X1 [Elysia marginata]
MMKAISGLPYFYLSLCDVRDVARVHLVCMTHPEAAGNRHIVYTKFMQLPEIGDVLKTEFHTQGYDPLTKTVPNIAVRIMSWFDSETSSRYNTLKQPMPFDNFKLRNVLEIEPISAEKSLIDMVYRLIELGMLPKTDQYKGPSS